jgi:hypothetical protein
MRRWKWVCLAALWASGMSLAQDKSNASIRGKLLSDIFYLPIQKDSVTAIRAGLPPFTVPVPFQHSSSGATSTSFSYTIVSWKH